jgi:hypothetical protein
MKSIFCKGIKQTDYEIFKYIDDKDIRSICLLNRYANQIINEDNFWLERFFYKYGEYIENVDIKKFRHGKNWRDYYIDVYKYINDPFPYYSSAMASFFKRYDVLSIFENMLKIENVKNVIVKHKEENELEYFYTRDGTSDGIKEGYHYTFYLDELTDLNFNYLFISRKTNKTEKIYKNGNILSKIVYENKNKILEIIYGNKGINTIKWNKKGVKIYEENDFNGQKQIKEWFVDGKIKSEKFYHNDKKTGTWLKWNKKGEKIEKYYLNDKLKPYKPMTQRENFELLDKLRNCKIVSP